VSRFRQQRDGVRPETAYGFKQRKREEQRERGAQAPLAGLPGMIMSGVAVPFVCVIAMFVVIVLIGHVIDLRC
jgi:hypothetical protein